MAAIPKTMEAAAIDRFGGPEELSIHTLPVPKPAANEVLIALHSAGVASWDAEMRDGWSPNGGRPKFPLVLGTDGAGTVAAKGSRVRRLKTGDKVYGVVFEDPKHRFYAEYVTVPAPRIARIPKQLTLEEAGAAPITGLTALQGIEDALNLKRGERLIILGASGGVGTLALQFAKQRGAKVLAIASGKDGVALAKKLGADVAVDGRNDDIAAAARRFAPAGVDAVLALAGSPALTHCVNALRRGGRLAHPNGVEPKPRKRRGLKIIAYDGVPGIRQFAALGRAIEKAKLQVPIAASYSLANAAKAHERLKAGHVLGKIILEIKKKLNITSATESGLRLSKRDYL